MSFWSSYYTKWVLYNADDASLIPWHVRNNTIHGKCRFLTTKINLDGILLLAKSRLKEPAPGTSILGMGRIRCAANGQYKTFHGSCKTSNTFQLPVHRKKPFKEFWFFILSRPSFSAVLLKITSLFLIFPGRGPQVVNIRDSSYLHCGDVRPPPQPRTVSPGCEHPSKP